MKTVNKSYPSTSVCIPCTPIEVQYLYDCLSSIANQTELPSEVVVVVSEATLSVKKRASEIINLFTNKLPIICHFFPSKQTDGTNRNEAIKLSSGEIVTFLDAMDTMSPNKIAIVKNIFHDYPSTISLLHYFLENTPLYDPTTNKGKNKDTKLPCEDQSDPLDRTLIEPYTFDKKLNFNHVCFNRTLFEEYPDLFNPAENNIAVIKQILPQYEKELLIYKAPLTSYMSNIRSLYDKYPKAINSCILNRANESLSVAVCIPCIPRHVEYLYDCFLSIANQTILPEEVILIVSESTDSVKESVHEIIKDLESTLNIICRFFPNKQYAGTNRNEAIKLATSDIISLIDADDIMYADRISITKDIFHYYPAAIGFLHYFTENQYPSKNETEIDPCHTSELKEYLINQYYYNEKLHFGHASFKKSIFNSYSYSEKPRGQDIEFVKNILPEHIQNLLIYKAPLTFYISNRSSYYNLDNKNIDTNIFSNFADIISFHPKSLLNRSLSSFPDDDFLELEGIEYKSNLTPKLN